MCASVVSAEVLASEASIPELELFVVHRTQSMMLDSNLRQYVNFLEWFNGNQQQRV